MILNQKIINFSGDNWIIFDRTGMFGISADSTTEMVEGRCCCPLFKYWNYCLYQREFIKRRYFQHMF